MVRGIPPAKVTEDKTLCGLNVRLSKGYEGFRYKNPLPLIISIICLYIKAMCCGPGNWTQTGFKSIKLEKAEIKAFLRDLKQKILYGTSAGMVHEFIVASPLEQ